MDETITAYPLTWPVGRGRSRRQARSNFETTFAVARDELVAEVKRMGGTKLILSSNCALRQDGLPLAVQRRMTDCGVAAYFVRNDKRVCFACDRWDRIEDNMRAIVKTIDAIRGIARWGTGDMLEAAFTGFLSLPAPTGPRWWTVFSVDQNARNDDVREVYRRMRGRGSNEEQARVNVAWDQFTAERGVA